MICANLRLKLRIPISNAKQSQKKPPNLARNRFRSAKIESSRDRTKPSPRLKSKLNRLTRPKTKWWKNSSNLRTKICRRRHRKTHRKLKHAASASPCSRLTSRPTQHKLIPSWGSQHAWSTTAVKLPQSMKMSSLALKRESKAFP